MRVRGWLMGMLALLLLWGGARPAQAEETVEGLAGELQQELLNREEITEVQEALEELLGEDSFSFFDALLELMEGDTDGLKERFGSLLWEALSRQLIQEKELFFQVILLVLAAALLANFSHLFSGGQIGEISFYVVYLLLLTLLLKAFGTFDLVSLDCTGCLGIGWDWRDGHMSLKTNLEVMERLRREGTADEKTIFVTNHFSHNGGQTYDEMVPEMAKHGIVVAYDGLEIEF